jgi:SAM-dependent methyltransferase
MDTAHDDPVIASVAAYTGHSADYAASNADKAAAQHDRMCALIEPADHVVLDAGCGPGRDLVRFAERGHCVIGVELNPEFVDLARAATYGWPVHVEHGDLRNLLYDDDSFDAVWACASLVHLDTADAATALGELHRVARPGAPLYVSVKIGDTDGWVDSPHGRRWFRYWNPDEFAAAVTAAGFTVTAVEPDGVFVDVWATA